MFNTLPQALQTRVIQYLSEDNFVEAKRIYDSWLKQTENVDKQRTHLHENDVTNQSSYWDSVSEQ